MIVRYIDANDIKLYRTEIIEYIQSDFMVTYGRYAEDDYVNSKIEGLIKYSSEGKAVTIGAFADEKMVGFLWGYLLDTPFERVFHIAYIAIDEEYRHKGIGTDLLNEVYAYVEKYDDINSVELIVGAKNDNALKFYCKNGFTIDRYMCKKKVRKIK